jgi:wobble nucleotide-excising tRNase
MIESIDISGIATYTGDMQHFGSLKKINFIYGANSSGKTSISRVISDDSIHPGCVFNWQGARKLKSLVYNRDFVEKNFNQSSDLKGVFTLGEESEDTLNKIKAAKIETDKLVGKIEAIRINLEGNDTNTGKNAELLKLEDNLKLKCWEQKKKYDDKFSVAFEGYRNSSDRFKTKILQESLANLEKTYPINSLEFEAKKIFAKSPQLLSKIPNLINYSLSELEKDPILTKKIVGKNDVDIAGIINKLNNSDWIRDGLIYYKESEGTCPFCQQNTPDTLQKSLEEYFDDTFESERTSVATLSSNYLTKSQDILNQIEKIILLNDENLDLAGLESNKKTLESIIALNTKNIQKKLKELSIEVSLDDTSIVIGNVLSLIKSANNAIDSHNEVVSNLSVEKKNLTNKIWRYLLDIELKIELDEYTKNKNLLEKTIREMKARSIALITELSAKKDEIMLLEKTITSIRPTVISINSLLSSFGFKSFAVAEADDGIHYKLVRGDGSEAKNSLSEGEKTFITFLYFYYLIKGNVSESGLTDDRVVVFDDPVSSLDSDILFIVSSLIRELMEEVRKNTGYIKQIFIFTHNVYFHKEITFNANKKKNDESFWIIRKISTHSRIFKHETNPIKTSYELLWSEVRKPEPTNLTIQNTLRRILENYFKILGGVDPEKICNMFNGKEKLICKSLFSWVNDGSHFSHDDLYVTLDQNMVDTYLHIFKEIFVKSEHLAHYKMMMGEAYIEDKIEEQEPLKFNNNETSDIVTSPIVEADLNPSTAATTPSQTPLLLPQQDVGF